VPAKNQTKISSTQGRNTGRIITPDLG